MNKSLNASLLALTRETMVVLSIGFSSAVNGAGCQCIVAAQTIARRAIGRWKREKKRIHKQTLFGNSLWNSILYSKFGASNSRVFIKSTKIETERYFLIKSERGKNHAAILLCFFFLLVTFVFASIPKNVDAYVWDIRVCVCVCYWKPRSKL